MALTQELPPKLPYDINKERFAPTAESMQQFWKSSRTWLDSRGVSLYDLRLARPWHYLPAWIAPPVSASAPLPFATRLNRGRCEVIGRAITARPYALAQDSAGRDVFVKIIKRSSPEYHINKFLLMTPESQVAHAFPHVLLPTMMLDSSDYSFMISPLWGEGCNPLHFRTVGQILVYIRCLLSGLAFLHKHRIAHRDISDHNVLTSGYCPELTQLDALKIVDEHSRSSAAAFSIIDLDLAIHLPGVSLRQCRRPSGEAFYGSPMYHPYDYSLGESEYNPFAFDVGCLGNMFLYLFTNAIPTVPPLAALFAKMTTYQVEQRFTVAEALSFYIDHLSSLPEELLKSAVTLAPKSEPLRDPDVYWSLLGPGDCDAWKTCRVPPKPWGRRLLLWIAETEVGWEILCFVRRMLRI